MKTKHEIKPIDFPCEHCGAKPGKRCTTAGGTEVYYQHISRTRQARRAKEKAPGRWGPEPNELLVDGVTRRDEDGDIPPQLPGTWRAAFLKNTLRTGFCLSLSQPMLEQLCAVADGVHWDRCVFRNSMGHAMPDNPATLGSLSRRGLVRHRGTKILNAEGKARQGTPEEIQRWHDNICDVWELTPAGEKLVELLKLAGVFVQATAASDLEAVSR